MSVSDEERGARRRGLWKRVLACAMGCAVLAVAVVGGYSWLLKARADRIYALGKSVNEFFSGYATAIKGHDVDAILEFYHDDYANPSEGTWSESRVETGDQYLEGVSADVFELKMESPRAFAKGDLRAQIEELDRKISEIEFAKFKVEGIEEPGRDRVTVRAIRWMRGMGPKEKKHERVELRAELRFWLARSGGDWKIVRKDLLTGTVVRGAGKGFVDVAKASGIDFKATHNEMLRDPHWEPTQFGIMKYAHGGVAVSDYDGDGDDDVFFADGTRPRLYRNAGDGTFEDVTAIAFAGQFDPDGSLPASSVALFIDADNDGDEDLFVGRSTAPNKLFCNKGDGTFYEVKDANVGRKDVATEGEWVSVASAADFDNDGFVDLYFGRYLDPRETLPTTLFYTRNGEGNSLLRNNGDLTFTDVTEEMKVREGGLTLGIAWADYDRDGDMDFYVANDFGRNAFFENQGPSGRVDSKGKAIWNPFKEVSAENGTLDISYGMSATFADIDNDADLDLYVSNVHSGQRWFGNKATLQNYIATTVRQREFFGDSEIYDQLNRLADDKWALGDRVIRGNSLFRNDGNGEFADVTEASRTNPHGWYWGSLVFDYDHDGRQDIYAVNGWISGKRPDDL